MTNRNPSIEARHSRPDWKQFLRRIAGMPFNAAVRLHRYRDVHDAMLRRVFREQEVRILAEDCCNE